MLKLFIINLLKFNFFRYKKNNIILSLIKFIKKY